ncbi:MAG: metallophosphoesterase [Sphingobium sp.]
MKAMVRRHWRLIALIATAIGLALLWHMYSLATSDPVVRQTTVAVDDPHGLLARPIRLALISDTHVSGPDMPPERLARIVASVNAQKPDIILLAGDYLGNDKPFGKRYAVAKAIAPFAGLRAPLGVLAVLGNHDYWNGAGPAVKQALRASGVTLLENQAVRLGPLAIGGVDDLINGKPDVSGTIKRARTLGGIPVIFAHEPDIFVIRRDFKPLMLAGHTHCGQVSLPWIGPLWLPSKVGAAYPCGRYDENGRTLIVTGGVGTSGLPIRLGVSPEFSIITLVPAAR